MRRVLLTTFVALMVALATAASASAASLTLAWDPPTDGITTGYFVYYGTEPGVYPNRVDAGDTNSFTVSGLATSTKYYLVVRAYNTNGVLSDPSNEVSATTGTTTGTTPPPPPPPPGTRPPPPPVSGLALAATTRADRYIDLAWTAAGGDANTQFRVEVGMLPGFTTFSAITTGRSISFDMTDRPVPAYFVRVRPMAGTTFGTASNEVSVVPRTVPVAMEEVSPTFCSTPPRTPRSFSALATGAQVSLSWQRGLGDPPSGYILDVGTAPGLADMMTLPLGEAPSLSANAANGRYALRLRATNACGTSLWGAETVLTVGNGSTTVSLPGAPQSLQGTVSGALVSFTWSPPTSGGPVANYVIEATIPGGTTFSFNTGSSAAAFSYDGAPPGQYVIRVRAANAAGLGAASAPVTIVVQ